LCLRLSAAPEFKGLPVALFASWQRADDVAAGLEAGAEYVLAKELLLQPEAWEARLREILPAPHGRREVLFLELLQRNAPTSTTQQGLDVINRTLRVLVRHSPGPQVVRVLVNKALRLIRGQSLDSTPAAPGAWLLPDGLGLQPGGLTVRECSRIAFDLANQLWRVLGKEGTAAIEALLSAAPEIP
jgi:hypothetical protein